MTIHTTYLVPSTSGEETVTLSAKRCKTWLADDNLTRADAARLASQKNDASKTLVMIDQNQLNSKAQVMAKVRVNMSRGSDDRKASNTITCYVKTENDVTGEVLYHPFNVTTQFEVTAVQPPAAVILAALLESVAMLVTGTTTPDAAPIAALATGNVFFTKLGV